MRFPPPKIASSADKVSLLMQVRQCRFFFELDIDKVQLVLFAFGYFRGHDKGCARRYTLRRFGPCA